MRPLALSIAVLLCSLLATDDADACRRARRTRCSVSVRTVTVQRMTVVPGCPACQTPAPMPPKRK
jgi:hypothetical protein